MPNPSKPEARYLPLHQLTPGQFQPREHFDPEQIQELARSLKITQGVLQPLIVRPLGRNHYEIIAGERRWRAAQLAELEEIHCLIGHYTDEQAIEAAIIENIHRADLNPIEEASAYQRMIDSFGYSHEEIGAAIGSSRTKVTNTLRLLKLDQHVQNLLASQQISEGHGKVLAGVALSHQHILAKKCILHGWSVRQLEKAAHALDTKQGHVACKADNDSNIQALEHALSEYLGCQTTVYFHKNKGHLTIDFYTLDILEGLFKKIGFK